MEIYYMNKTTKHDSFKKNLKKKQKKKNFKSPLTETMMGSGSNSSVLEENGTHSHHKLTDIAVKGKGYIYLFCCQQHDLVFYDPAKAVNSFSCCLLQ